MPRIPVGIRNDISDCSSIDYSQLLPWLSFSGLEEKGYYIRG